MQPMEFSSKKLNEKYYYMKHPSGLRIYIHPKQNYNSTYAVFGTNFGSVNNKFRLKSSNKLVEVPDGIAHFLEHKLFEGKEADAFELFAKTGASANAFTSFEKTAYLFSCSENFEQSLEILLNFVQSPFFTEQTIAKEQGIIGQEIKMYQDSPDWRVLFNLLNCLYVNHPVKIDIAGSVESIAKITPEMLYQCYSTYYNLNNMSLCIAGNVDVDKTFTIINDLLQNKYSKPMDVENIFPNEPNKICKNINIQKMDVATPMFNLGFKETVADEWGSPENYVYTSILLYAMFSKSSDIYKKLLDLSLINTSSFSYEHFKAPYVSSIMFSGESNNPHKVADILKSEIYKIKKSGIDKNSFERAKKTVYASSVSLFENVSGIANSLLTSSFTGHEKFGVIDLIAESKLEYINKRLNSLFDDNLSALSIIEPNG